MSGEDERRAAKRRPSLRRALRYSLLDGCAYSLMAGGAESYLTAFAVHLGVPARQVGLLGSVPQLVGSAAQLLTPHGVRAVRGLKRWVVILACLQALVLAAHATIPWIPGPPFLPLLLLLVSYWTVNLAIAPAWNHWMALLVPASRRATYFARRNRVLHVCMLAGLAMSGFFLQRSAGMGAAIRGFMIVVLSAAPCGSCPPPSSRFKTARGTPSSSARSASRASSPACGRARGGFSSSSGS